MTITNHNNHNKHNNHDNHISHNNQDNQNIHDNQKSIILYFLCFTRPVLKLVLVFETVIYIMLIILLCFFGHKKIKY